MNGQPAARQVRDSAPSWLPRFGRAHRRRAGTMPLPHAHAQPRHPVPGLDVVREPGRIAAELQHQVIQAIFAVGLDLQSTAAITADPLVRDRMDKAASDLDDVINLLRDAVSCPSPC